MCVCMCTHIHNGCACVHTYIMGVHKYICIHMQTRAYTSVRRSISSACTWRDVGAGACVYSYTKTCIHVYIHVCAYTCSKDQVLPLTNGENTQNEVPVTLLWVLVYLAQHFDKKRLHAKGLEYIEEVICVHVYRYLCNTYSIIHESLMHAYLHQHIWSSGTLNLLYTHTHIQTWT
jgi:hypothetical protein